MKDKVAAVAVVVGIGATVVAVTSSGTVQLIAASVSLYGAVVVVVAAYPSRRAIGHLHRPHLFHRPARHI